MSRAARITVAAVVAETPDARSVVFQVPPEKVSWFRHRPGQFVTVRVPLGEGVARCYSLSNGPDEPPTITVKRAGPASAWICDHLQAGQELELLPPAGRFTPASPDTDLLLIAAGSGITPVMAILRWVLASGSAHVALLYANRDADSVIFARQLNLLAIRHPGRLHVIHWLESERGLPERLGLGDDLRPFAVRETFLCGPELFMEQAAAALKDVQAGLERQGHARGGRLHQERYESLREDPFVIDAAGELAPGELAPGEGEVAAEVPPGASVLQVELDGRERRVTWALGRTLLEALEDASIGAPFSCREGSCGACTCLLVEGQVSLRNNQTLTDDDLNDGYILACQADPQTPVIRVSYD